MLPKPFGNQLRQPRASDRPLRGYRARRYVSEMETPLRVPHDEPLPQASRLRAMALTPAESAVLAALRALRPSEREEWMAILADLAGAKIK
jgi:hypothetical protein